MGMVFALVVTCSFFASSGQELAYEIADWNTSGTSSIWVKAPSISGTNTVITAAWGKTGTETTPDYSTDDPVWSNGYEGAWHLDQISSGITNDSSPNGIHLTVNGGQPQPVATQVMRSLLMAQTTNWRPLGTKVFPVLPPEVCNFGSKRPCG